jgi:hypothetical protein
LEKESGERSGWTRGLCGAEQTRPDRRVLAACRNETDGRLVLVVGFHMIISNRTSNFELTMELQHSW